MPIKPLNNLTPDPSDRTRKMQRTAAAALYAVLVLIELYTAHTFIPAVVWAGVIAIALWPAFRWLERRPVFYRHHIALSALVTAAIGLLFVVPFFIVAAQTVAEAQDTLRWFHEVLRTGIPMPPSSSICRWARSRLRTGGKTISRRCSHPRPR